MVFAATMIWATVNRRAAGQQVYEKHELQPLFNGLI